LSSTGYGTGVTTFYEFVKGDHLQSRNQKLGWSFRDLIAESNHLDLEKSKSLHLTKSRHAGYFERISKMAMKSGYDELKRRVRKLGKMKREHTRVLSRQCCIGSV
ncbi:MAG: hypothetical protein JW932_00615, partial [Deltaproteobacteria bacterium]|nr:hypothetical protein [Deltaproteobacteria bacterium]